MKILTLGCALLLPVIAYAQTADIIFTDADIYTGGHFSTPGDAFAATDGPRAKSIAIANGKIVAIGGDDEVLAHKGPKTQIVDLGGKFVMPGFNDAHCHLANGGQAKLEVDLVGVKSLEEMKQRVADGEKKAAPGEWVLGRGWDHTMWPSQQLPSRQDLDAVTAGHPAFFVRVDGHIAVANSAALKIAGLNRNSKDIPGGQADRDSSGELTGIVRESTKDAFYKVIPPISAAKRRQAIELVLAEAAQWGLTSAQDNSSWEDFLVYDQLRRESKLTLRIAEWLRFNDRVKTLVQQRGHNPSSDTMLHTTQLKGFMDGSLGSATAAMLQPYSDNPKNAGLPQYDQATLTKLTVERAAVGFQIGFHAIGDRGANMALNAFQEALRQAKAAHSRAPAGSQSFSDFRFRVEHAQVVAPADVPRFRELGVIASMQPNHLLTDMNWAESRIGPERAKTSYAWADFLKTTGHLAFGTDYPVEPITPFRGLYAAVTRMNEAGTKTYYAEQKLNIHQAIYAYTWGAAYAEFEEGTKGILARGYLADFVVLDRDITRISPPEILQTKVLRTVVGGRTVYEAR
ncbi:MAG TPA: amidohydrolase [Terriglobales bacterium]|jgi:predicted amidohydrolase YtcJ|nr:amidohydrolase [Terriglobales bacterium]